MKVTVAAGVPSLHEEVTRRALSGGDDAQLERAVERLAQVAEATLDGLIFFGSRRTGAAHANVWSAYDVFVIVREYRPFYQAMRRAGLSGKGAGLLSVVSRWLPPTQYSIRFRDLPVHLKAAVIRTDTFHREMSARRRDHFCTGRLFQPSRILHARDGSTREALVRDLVQAHAETWSWARPWLPAEFDAEAYGRRALEVSMSWEVRPEPAGRATALWEAQKAEQAPVFELLLRDLAAGGHLVPAAGGAGRWSPRATVTRAERLRWTVYFRRSIVRATARWLKHVVSFEGWLDYIVRKASRHTGEPIELTERERRWPWLFAWARFFRYLRTKDRRGSGR